MAAREGFAWHRTYSIPRGQLAFTQHSSPGARLKWNSFFPNHCLSDPELEPFMKIGLARTPSQGLPASMHPHSAPAMGIWALATCFATTPSPVLLLPGFPHPQSRPEPVATEYSGDHTGWAVAAADVWFPPVQALAPCWDRTPICCQVTSCSLMQRYIFPFF